MKIRRFFAKDMRTGLACVSKALGPEAAILSTTKVNGGVEIVAATDYEQALEAARMAKKPLSVKASLAPPSVAPTTAKNVFQQTLADVRQDEPQAQPLTGEIPAFPPNDTDRETGLGREMQQTASKRVAEQSGIEWGEDPSFARLREGLREEMQLLRGLLQAELSGLNWQQRKKSQPTATELLRRLVGMGLPVSMAARYTEREVEGEIGDAWYRVAAHLAQDLSVADTDPVAQGGVYALVGSTGVGKTTTIAKLAARASLAHGATAVGLISADNYRIAAQEQLRIYGKIMSIDTLSVSGQDELERALLQFSDKHLVLIDTAGVGQRDDRLKAQLACLSASPRTLRALLVLSATAHLATLSESLKHFGQMKLDGAILTKLDEATSLGPALASLIRTQLPLHFVTNGQRVPEDITNASAHVLITEAIKLANDYPLDRAEEWRIASELSNERRSA